MISTAEILKELGLSAINAGGSTGTHWWASGENTALLESVNPATGETIAHIRTCSADDYEHIVRESMAAFQQWRLVPAPKRGELVRLIGVALREQKDLLGSLVSLDVDLGCERVPDETTVLKFRHLLEANDLGKKLLDRKSVV